MSCTHSGSSADPLARWTDVGFLEDIPRQGSRVLPAQEPGGQPVAVFRTFDDQLFALVDRCPHRQGPLSQGIVHGRSVTCPLHSQIIDLATGEVRAPDEGCARTVPLKVEGGRVLVQLP